ncbi:MAG: hypothetical protein DRN71_04765 [Candidatus Nanohalarchaeota archaeon]|nr:MAG: hypothetical protein DRN71_04765 [Candidatus Nanohaloarchaeota archaeon]
MLKKAEANFDIARKRKDILFEQSKKLSFDEIKSFEDKNSYFIEQDRIIMKLNKMFYEQFKMDIDDFSDSVFELSNDKARFRDMYEFYLLISKELEDACLDTNYMLDIKFITYTPLLKAFAGFVLADIGLLENGLAEVKMEAIREFESTKNNFLSRTREKIMAHEKKIIKDTIDDLNSSKDVSEKEKAQHYSEFLRKISEFKPESIEQFLTEMIAFLRNECIRLKHLEDEQLTEMKINYLEHLRANPDEIPYLKDVEKENEKIIFDDEKYYDYLDMPDDMYYLTKLLVCARLFFRKEYKKAYTLVCELNFDKNNCFAEMFFIGKVLSLFEDKGYKQYFKQAKKIDKPRYKTELEEFLAWKDDFKRIENRV